MVPVLQHHVHDLQPLAHKVTFDGAQRLILVNFEVTSLDIRLDVYSAWKEWSLLRDHTKFLFAIRSIGGDPTVQGQRAGDIYFLMNGWKLLFAPWRVQVTGILYSEDYTSAFFNPIGIMILPVVVSSLVTTVETPTNVVTGDLSDVPTAAEIAAAVVAHNKTLTLQRYLGLR